MDKKAKEFNHKVAFMEAITEAPLQLCLSLLVVREYGISAVPGTKILQLTSLLTSSFSICLAYLMVSMTYVFKFLGCIHLLNTRNYCDNTLKYCGNTHEY